MKPSRNKNDRRWALPGVGHRHTIRHPSSADAVRIVRRPSFVFCLFFFCFFLHLDKSIAIRHPRRLTILIDNSFSLSLSLSVFFRDASRLSQHFVRTREIPAGPSSFEGSAQCDVITRRTWKEIDETKKKKRAKDDHLRSVVFLDHYIAVGFPLKPLIKKSASIRHPSWTEVVERAVQSVLRKNTSPFVSFFFLFFSSLSLSTGEGFCAS